MLEAEVRLINPLGLHARAAAKLVRTASKFASDVQVRNSHRAADGKSILGILALAAACGSTLTITSDGRDESEALEEIRKLFDSGFGEI